MRALDERPPWIDQDDEGVTYAHKIEAADRALDPTRTPAEVERTVRALRPHVGARLPLPGGGYLGVIAARPAGPTLAPAGGRVRTDGDRLLLDCRGGALALTEIQPPGGRPMPAEAWLRGRPDPALTEFWLDPRLPGRETGESSSASPSANGTRARSGRRTWLRSAGAARPRCSRRSRRSPTTRTRGRAASPPTSRDSSARLCERMPEASAALLERMGEHERDPASWR